jgi:hypothetical protein
VVIPSFLDNIGFAVVMLRHKFIVALLLGISTQPPSTPVFPYFCRSKSKVVRRLDAFRALFMGVIWWAHQDSNLGPAD